MGPVDAGYYLGTDGVAIGTGVGRSGVKIVVGGA